MLEEGGAYQLIGTLRAVGSLCAAPLTGRSCVAYVARARVWDRLDFTGELVKHVVRCELAPCVLQSDEGDLLVEASDLVIARPVLDVYGVSPAQLLPDELRAYAGSTFYDEVIVLPGERVVVSGVVAHTRDILAADHGYRDAPMRVQLTGYADRPLRIA